MFKGLLVRLQEATTYLPSPNAVHLERANLELCRSVGIDMFGKAKSPQTARFIRYIPGYTVPRYNR